MDVGGDGAAGGGDRMSDYAERVTGLVSQLADARAEVADLRLRINAVDAEHEQLAKDRAELSARFYAAIRRAKAEGLLVWTTDLPKVPGWYWRRYEHEQAYMEIVQVDVSDAGIVAHSHGNGSWVPTLQQPGVEWAGPLSVPLDARAKAEVVT